MLYQAILIQFNTKPYLPGKVEGQSAVSAHDNSLRYFVINGDTIIAMLASRNDGKTHSVNLIVRDEAGKYV